MRLEGKIALVTGGATGIGRAIVLALAREGAVVAVNYSTSAVAAETAGLVEQAAKIRVNAVAPALLATGFGDGSITRDLLEEAGRVTPMGRPATVDEAADVVVFLLANGSVTGHTSVVDGGLTALGPVHGPR